MIAPGTIAPEVRIDRPAATRANFRERPGLPALLHLTVTPGTITHETQNLTVTMFASGLVADAGRQLFTRGFKASTVTPWAETPLRKNSLVAAGAYMAEMASVIKPVLLASAPGTSRHALGDYFATINTSKEAGENFPVFFYEGTSSYFPPVNLTFLL